MSLISRRSDKLVPQIISPTQVSETHEPHPSTLSLETCPAPLVMHVYFIVYLGARGLCSQQDADCIFDLIEEVHGSGLSRFFGGTTALKGVGVSKIASCFVFSQ